VIPRFDRYDKQPFQGTSMAAPHVAGLAALLMSQMPSLTGAQVEKIIRMTAKDLGTKGKDDSFGYGLIQPRAALYGYGISR
jgi:serine protease